MGQEIMDKQDASKILNLEFRYEDELDNQPATVDEILSLHQITPTQHDLQNGYSHIFPTNSI